MYLRFWHIVTRAPPVNEVLAKAVDSAHELLHGASLLPAKAHAPQTPGTRMTLQQQAAGGTTDGQHGGAGHDVC